jgi:hypothetical protein
MSVPEQVINFNYGDKAEGEKKAPSRNERVKKMMISMIRGSDTKI